MSNTCTGTTDGLKYTNGYKPKVQNQRPIITARGVNADPPQDQYFKGALFLNTLRSVVNDDKQWWALLHDFYQHFKYQNIMTEDVVAYFNQIDQNEPDSDLRSVSAAHGNSYAGTEIQREQWRTVISLESG